MPRAALREDYLPAVFRRRPLPMGAQTGEPEGLAPNVLMPQDPAAPAPVTPPPGQPTFAEQYLRKAVPLTPEEEAAYPQPNVLSPAVPAAAPEVEQPTIVDDATRHRRVETNEKGRPVRNIMLQGDDQTLDFQKRLASMPEDKQGGGWWPRIAAALAGFAAGGPIGAAAGFGARALREKFDPTLGSREYRAQQMGQLAPAIDTIQKSRKEARDIRKDEASIGLAEARTDELKNRKDKEKWVIKLDDAGVYRAVNQATGLDPDGKSVKGRTVTGNDWVLKIDNRNRYVPVNKQTGLDQSGKQVIARTPAGKDEEDVEFGNKNIQQGIQEAKAEQAKIDAALYSPDGTDRMPRTIEGTDILTGMKKMVANPEWTNLMSRRRKLDDQIRTWRQKLKAPKKGTAAADDGEEEDDDPLGLFEDEEE